MIHSVLAHKSTQYAKAFFALLVLVLALAACGAGSPKAAPPTTLEGAWLGNGVFRASVGSREVEAQLELLSDGSYRFLVLKPAILAMTGVEEGNWTRNGQTLTLIPVAIPPMAEVQSDANPSGGVFQQLRQGSPVDSKPPKTITIAEDLGNLHFDDGKLSLTFLPNPTATTKLREVGDVRAD